MRVLQGNGGIDPEPNEKLFLLSDDQLLPLMDVRPLKKLMDRSRTEGELFLLCDDDLLLQTDVNPSNKLMDRSKTQGEIVSTLR